MSILSVDTIQPVSTGTTVTVSNGDLVVGTGVTVTSAGIVSATSYYGSGANLTGISVVGGASGVDFNDDVKARFGTGNDLEIYHDPDDSKIHNGTGNLRITSNDIQLRDTAQNFYVNCNNGGAVKLYHNGTEQCSTSASGLAFPAGKGIDFSATGNAGGMSSELLDTYEEGTWTMALSASGSDPSYSLTSGVCNYRRVGQIVHFTINLQFNSWVDGSGNLKWSLPFSARSGTGQFQGVGSIMFASGFESAAGTEAPYGCYCDPGQDFFYVVKSGGNTSVVQADNMTTSFNHHYIGHGTYVVD